MQSVIPQTKQQRLRRALDTSWDILSQRIATGRITINKEASLQLHYASILHSYGELLCTDPGETFSIELESALDRCSIDITCALDGLTAAVELKCFRKQSNRPADTDMYDVLLDVQRLISYPGFAVRKFICLTDDPYYVTGAHSGHAGTVTIKDGTFYPAGTIITPSWAGTWKSQARDAPISLARPVKLEWSRDRNWYALCLTFDDEEPREGWQS
ncbi:MAG TPA: hypothetical protein VGO11_05105 [Chthoniobacteraceae bacterium]|jgi:hypothetical protein|nr:hypothetical protein [Chthoniobacteraceae bacterium]